MTTFTQKCRKCSCTISGGFENMGEWLKHLEMVGWVLTWFGWCCPDCAKNVPEGEKV